MSTTSEERGLLVDALEKLYRLKDLGLNVDSQIESLEKELLGCIDKEADPKNFSVERWD
jgi:hypothetical protein